MKTYARLFTRKQDLGAPVYTQTRPRRACLHANKT